MDLDEIYDDCSLEYPAQNDYLDFHLLKTWPLLLKIEHTGQTADFGIYLQNH